MATRVSSPRTVMVPLDERVRRVRELTVEARPWLCPEFVMHLITYECPLWYRTEDELNAAGIETPYWGFAWPGGQALARYILDHPESVRGRRIVDVGAGGGIEALAAMRAGARAALLSDIDPMACTAATLNAARNGIEVTCTTDDLIGRDDPAWEVILVGDLFYEAEVSARMLPWLRALVTRGVTVLVGDPFRGNVPGECVEALAHYDAPFDTDVRGLYLRCTQVVRLLGGRA